MRGHGFQCIDLLRHFHGANFRSHGSPNPAGNHQAGQDGAKFTGHCHAYNRERGGVHFYLVKLKKCLRAKNHAGGGPGGKHNEL